jgi:molybdenum cofactor biosynthesis protein B
MLSTNSKHESGPIQLTPRDLRVGGTLVAMTDAHGSMVPRVTVATVALGRTSAREDAPKVVVDELQAARFVFVRGVTVNREKQFIAQLVSTIANSNEADAIILVGGVGMGPRDFTCEAIDELADRKIEGFGEAYRRLLRDDLAGGVHTILTRASAIVCNKCVVIALPRHVLALRMAMRTLVVPTLAEAVRMATGAAAPHGTTPPPHGTTPPPKGTTPPAQ